ARRARPDAPEHVSPERHTRAPSPRRLPSTARNRSRRGAVMTEREALIEEAAGAWRQHQAGAIRFHPAWAALDAAGRLEAFEIARVLRKLEAALDPRGCRRQRARFSRALEPDPLRLTGSGRFRYDFVHARIDRAFYRLEVGAMTWEAPDFIEVKMDAEI